MTWVKTEEERWSELRRSRMTSFAWILRELTSERSLCYYEVSNYTKSLNLREKTQKGQFTLNISALIKNAVWATIKTSATPKSGIWVPETLQKEEYFPYDKNLLYVKSETLYWVPLKVYQSNDLGEIVLIWVKTE